MRIGLIADWLNPCISQAIDRVREMGTTLDVIFADQELVRLDTVRVRHDLYVLKSGTEAALSLAGMLHAEGGATLNPYPVVARMRNKLLVTHALQAAGLAVPESYMTSNLDDVQALLSSGPLILKPHRGSRGEGILIVHCADELRNLASGGPTLVQRYHTPDGPDRKLYRIGDRVAGVLRRWPLRSYEDKVGEPFDPDDELCEIAFRCGDVFGIDLYGIDVVISEGRPFIVDMNKFGSFVGVPDGPRLIADYLVNAAYGRGGTAAWRNTWIPAVRSM